MLWQILSDEPIAEAGLVNLSYLDDGRVLEDLHDGELKERETGTPSQWDSKACVLPKYLVGGMESGGQDSVLHVTEGRWGNLSLHIGGPANLEIYLDLINIPEL